MSEILFVTAVFLLLIGAVGFYLYSRIAYSDRKMNYLESILIDLRLKAEMEKQHRHAPMPMPVKMAEPLEEEDSEEIADVKDDKAFYASVIESVAQESVIQDATEVVQDATNVVPSAGPDYDAMSRDEVATLAEKKSIRVTKRMNKATLVNLLRETEKNTSTTTETGKDGSTFFVEGTTTGTPISMGVPV